MSEQMCSERVYSTGGSMRGHPCGAPAKMQHEGRHYCGRHDPAKAAARRAATDAKRSAEWAKEDRKRKLDEAVRLAADAVVKAAREWKAAWHNQRYSPMEYEKAREALADAVAAHDKALAEQQEASRG